ncbi:MAG: thioredoxin family protein [Cyclobacteriaceae bacterium]|jgi:peroxiredoxin|nr:thioredoxin family protein [Cyclobacteriaceae bacterium]
MKKVLSLLAVAALLVAAAPVKEGYDVGDKVADFKLKNVDGKMVSLADFKTAKGFIVMFDCNTCPVSKAYNERILALNKKYASQGFPVIAINPNDPTVSAGDSFEKMVDYAKKKGYDFPYLVDETQNVAKAFGATNTPHVYVLTKDLTVAYIGSIDNSRDAANVTKKYVEEAVDALLAGKEVPTPKTKAVGCTIKWKPA